MKKVFKWLDFLRECEIKTIFGILAVVITVLSSVYVAQANITKWIVNAENAIVEGKLAMEMGKKRDFIVANHETRICVLEETFKSIDTKLNILIARGK